MIALRVVLGDQLTQSISCLKGINPSNDHILMCEVLEEATYVKHHPKKIAFLFSAMRHFAKRLTELGYRVHYRKLNDIHNTGSFDGELDRLVHEINPDCIIVTEPGEWRVYEKMKQWQEKFSIPVEIRDDDRFLCGIKEFKRWAGSKKYLRMEFFYREMRKKYNILLDEYNQPIGGKWNYDKENRKPPKKSMLFPNRLNYKKDNITIEVLGLVRSKFNHHFGDLEPFNFAVTREEALIELNNFIINVLPFFGDYQDAMVAGEPYVYHSLLSAYINAGLLLPLEVCRMAEEAYKAGKVSISSAEGFIRQILGWREYIRGIYWHYMPGYQEKNFLHATVSLPELYWGKPTKMFCMNEAVQHTKKHAYSHHIQRLMVTGNFALIAGIAPKQVQEWYLAVYADAYEWVELPNTLGMSLFGDGGIIASKPYAASGKYINRMSNYCKQCSYDPLKVTGENSCPFNALYWNFIARNKDKFKNNLRMKYIYSTWEKFSDNQKNEIILWAQEVGEKLSQDLL